MSRSPMPLRGGWIHLPDTCSTVIVVLQMGRPPKASSGLCAMPVQIAVELSPLAGS